MSRLGLREIRRPNTRGASLADGITVPAVQSPPLPFAIQSSVQENITQKSEANHTKTENKLATNREQTGNKVDTQLATNREQTGNTPKRTAGSLGETGNKVGTQPATLSATKWQQTDNKLTTNTPFSGLVGLQRAILMAIYDACKATRGRVSEPLTLEHLASRLKTSHGSVKTTLQRLESKNCILRVAFKNGRGGWSRYELPESIFRELLQLETENKLTTNWQQTGNKVGTQPATQPATSLSSSSSVLDLEKFKTTTTGESELFESTTAQLTPEWQSVDVSPLADSGFTQTHLIQIVRQGKLAPVEVQDSINFFAFDLARNAKGRSLNGSPLNFFMGILRKGIPYAPPDNFESPADEARRKTREFKERKERERQAEDQKLLELEFAEWSRGLASEELAKLLPEYARKPGAMQTAALKTHFETNVWPERAQELLGLTKVDRGEVVREINNALREVQT